MVKNFIIFHSLRMRAMINSNPQFGRSLFQFLWIRSSIPHIWAKIIVKYQRSFTTDIVLLVYLQICMKLSSNVFISISLYLRNWSDLFKGLPKSVRIYVGSDIDLSLKDKLLEIPFKRILPSGLIQQTWDGPSYTPWVTGYNF